MSTWESIKFNTVFSVIKLLYSTVLRPLLVNAVNDPDAEWDDFILAMVDRVFDYHTVSTVDFTTNEAPSVPTAGRL